MKRVFLVVPSIEDLKYRKMWMNDPETMSYNAGFDLDLKGYNKETGTILKTNDEMLDWYNKWVNKEPDRFFAYIHSVDESEPIGEVYYYPDGDIHSMGILISDKYRGKGYSYLALLALEEVAFERNDINELYDMIPLDRIGAIKSFKKAGFIHTDKEEKGLKFGNEVISKQLLITKEMYFKNKEVMENELCS